MKRLKQVIGWMFFVGMLVAVPVQAQTPERQARKALVAPQSEAAAAPALGKSVQDPRPLHGLDRATVPRYPSVAAYLAGRPSGDLRAAARVVGKANVVRRSVTAQAAAGLRRAAPSGLSLPDGDLRIERAPNGTIRWMQGDLGLLPAGEAGKQEATALAALAAAAPYAALLRLQDPAAELRPVQVGEDALGMVHVRFEQVYDGLPVWGRDMVVHADAAGRVYALNGTYEPTPEGAATVPALDATAARRTVVDDLTARGRWAPLPADDADWLGLHDADPALVLYPDLDLGVRLAYDVTLHANLLEHYTYLVDARTGAVLTRIARHCTLNPDAPPPTPMQVTALPRPALSAGTGTFVNATATDLNNQNQNLRVYQHDDGVFYKVWDLPNLNIAASTLPNNPNGGALTISANNADLEANTQLFHITSNNNTWSDPVGVSAHANMNEAFNYYQNTHGRNAIDGSGQSIVSIIHVTDGGQAMDNAFWNGRVMAYGDGDTAFRPLAGGLDVAGHEMTHGVIENTAGLIYQFQPGALNESFADVFGVMIDRDDLLLGEDVMQQDLALRDLLNPDNPQVLAVQPAHMNQYRNLNADQDNGGVHVNSGIPNRAAALVIQAIGRGDTERIYYRAMTTYLTRNSQFGDARNALVQSAEDLFGGGSAQATAVVQAFDAVGIAGTSGTGGGQGNDLPAQTGGSSLITFLLEDGRIGFLDLTDPNSVTVNTFQDPNALARVDDAAGDRSQLTTTRNGEEIWFINQQGQLAFIDLASGQVSVFENLSISAAGDLWNASISPDGRFAALVSAYDDDPTIYFTSDGQTADPLALTPETTQQGIKNATIRYPDVVAWSPNMQVPRIAFDALNEVALLGQSLTYWSMYEIDFSAGTILNLLPAQSSDVSAGNVTYSSNDPDRIAFNLIDEDGTWDVLVGNFESGGVEELNIHDFTANGQPILDAQRPTFSPDDGRLAYSSPALGILLLSDLGNTGAAPVFFDLAPLLGSPVYNPNWFVRGGSGGTGNAVPTASFTAGPGSGTAPLLVNFNASASSDPDGDPLTFRWNFNDGSTGSGVSTSHTFSSPGAYTVSLTVTDAGGASDTATRQIIVSPSISDAVVTLRNFDPTQQQFLWFAEDATPIDSGFVFGTNHFEDLAKATAFALPAGVSSGSLEEVRLWWSFKRPGLAGQTYDLQVLSGTPSGGPGALLHSETFLLRDVDADDDPQTGEDPMTYVLSQAVDVGSSFFVSVDFGSYGPSDWASASLAATDLLGRFVEEVWEQWSDQMWHNVSEAWFENDDDGWHLWAEADVRTSAPTASEPEAELPRTVALAPNYPNPFNPETVLRFDLPAAADVQLDVIDLLGRTVATLVEGPMPAGVHTARFDARSMPSGVYVARLRAGDATRTQTMVLAR